MKLLRENGLSLTLFALFAFSLAGQYFAGWYEYNEDQNLHGRAAVSGVEYLGEGHFWEALFENWESEFLQMAAYILLTFFISERASDSKRIDAVERVDRVLPKRFQGQRYSVASAQGRTILKIYENSLSLALMIFLFVTVVRSPRRGRMRRRTTRSRSSMELHRFRHLEFVGTSDLLVRVIPELAERVSLDRGARRAFDLFASEGFTRIEAGRRSAQRNGQELIHSRTNSMQRYRIVVVQKLAEMTENPMARPCQIHLWNQLLIAFIQERRCRNK